MIEKLQEIINRIETLRSDLLELERLVDVCMDAVKEEGA